jgi:hypothetical protein
MQTLMQSQPDVLLKAVYLLSYYDWHFSHFISLTTARERNNPE